MASEEPPVAPDIDVSDDVIETLNSMTLVPDGDQESSNSETSSLTGSATGSATSNTVDNDINNLWMADDSTENASEKQAEDNEESNGKIKKKKIFKNPIKMLRKLSQTDLAPPLALPEDPDLSSIEIDSLPQHFVVKYLGKKSCHGLQGVDYIRKPIDRMVREVTSKIETVELPLVQLTVWPKGLQATLHPKTKTKEFEAFYLPIDFISFCAEHGNYQKIVGMISVSQMGPKTTKTECLAYICHSVVEARKLTVSMATAFRQYAEKLNGSQVKFKVDLRDDKGRRRKKSDKECDA